MNATEDAIVAFKKAEVPADEYESVFQNGFEDIKEFVPEMKTAAEKMFTSFEETGKPVVDDTRAFERTGDKIIHLSDKIWNETSPSLLPPTPSTRERTLYGLMISAIEESYAYPATENITEKEHALANFAAFDTRMKIIESNITNESYEDLKLINTDLIEAGEKMFSSYEKDGVINQNDLKSLDILTEKIDENYRDNNKKLLH